MSNDSSAGYFQKENKKELQKKSKKVPRSF